MPRGGRTKKAKKGGYYSFSGDVAPGAANWTRHSEMGAHSISNRGGNAMYGRGRKRKGKKTGKKTKRVRRGGSRFGAVTASYQGSGSRGMANFAGISPNKPGFADKGGFNDNGAHSLADNSNFITAGSN